MNSITTAIATLLDTVTAFKNSMLERANSERLEMLDIMTRMGDTRNTIHSLMRECNDAGKTLLEMATSLAPVVEVIDDTLEGDIAVPEIPFENYRGTCENCGRDISLDENASIDEAGIGFICSECVNQEILEEA